MAGGARKDVVDETTGQVVASGVTEAQAKKISENLASSHTVKVKNTPDEKPATG